MTFGSVYEILDPLTVIRKQRFWDWFDGKQLKAWWTISEGSGVVMDDVVDGGIKIPASPTTSINFNNIRHYEPTGSVLIAITTRTGTGGVQVFFADSISFLHLAFSDNNSGITFMNLQTKDGSTSNTVNSTILTNTNQHVVKIELRASDARYFIDGILEATSSSNLPAQKLQPILRAFSNATHNVRYFEALNT